MKTFTAAMTAFILIIIGTCFYYNRLEKDINSMIFTVDAIMQSAEEDNWDSTELSLAHFFKHFEKSKKWFGIFIRHSEMDLINEKLYEVKAYVQYRDKKETIAHANVLRILLTHIPEQEAFTLENIL